MKYRIDDFMDVLLQCSRSSDSVLGSDGVDWLEEVALNPAVDDSLWLARRYPGFGNRERVLSSHRYALNPSDFMKHVFPVTTYHGYSSDGLVLDIDSSLVIGGMYRRNYSE